MPIPPTRVLSAADTLNDSTRWLSSSAVKVLLGGSSNMRFWRLRKRGLVPPPDAQVGGRNFWQLATIQRAKAEIERATREARASGTVIPGTSKATEARALRKRTKKAARQQEETDVSRK